MDAKTMMVKPVIGIAGGIGSGKSFVARLFGELGCLVIHADDQVCAAYDDAGIKQTIRDWWGDQVFRQDGSVDRSAISKKVFADPKERQRLEKLLHPIVDIGRERLTADAQSDPQVLAVVWDTPLLFETKQNELCDRIVFVDTPFALRLQRVKATRGWDEGELIRREKFQLPLDSKRELSHDVIVNTADADGIRSQVREILSRTLANR